MIDSTWKHCHFICDYISLEIDKMIDIVIKGHINKYRYVDRYIDRIDR